MPQSTLVSLTPPVAVTTAIVGIMRLAGVIAFVLAPGTVGYAIVDSFEQIINRVVSRMIPEER